MPDLEWSVDGDGIALLLLNRPERRNAFTFEMVDQWAEHLRLARTDDAVRVIVVTGAGQAFCSGVDLGSISNADTTLTPLHRKNELHERIHRVALALEDLDKPVIAALNGPAVGAGLDMALMCDLRIASSTARFSEGYINVGLVPGDGGAFFLPRLVGMAKALELLFTGDFVDAPEALRIGMVNRVVEPSDLMSATMELARTLAGKPPVTLRAIKRLVHQSADVSLRTALDMVSSQFAVVAATHDAAEALSAMREKRTPEYEGR